MKRLIRSIIRSLVYWRLRSFPLNENSALGWAERMKLWPGIFQPAFDRQKVTRYGARMNVGLIDVIERALYVSDSWDDHIAGVMIDHIKAGQTFVDVGANIGYFTLLGSKLVGASGTVIAVEPSHRNLKKLCDHLWVNQAGNVLVLSVAAGLGARRAAISFPTYNNAGAATLRSITTVQLQQTLQVGLDQIFELQSLSPNFIKLDIEGFELEALRGMERTLRRCSPVVVCELTDKFLRELGQSAQELLAFMEGIGYICEVVSTGASLSKGTPVSSRFSETPLDQVDVLFRRVQ